MSTSWNIVNVTTFFNQVKKYIDILYHEQYDTPSVYSEDRQVTWEKREPCTAHGVSLDSTRPEPKVTQMIASLDIAAMVLMESAAVLGVGGSY